MQKRSLTELERLNWNAKTFKLLVCLIKDHTIGTYLGIEDNITIPDQALDGSKWSASWSSDLTPVNSFGGPKSPSGHRREEKNLFCLPSHPARSARHTDWAAPAHLTADRSLRSRRTQMSTYSLFVKYTNIAKAFQAKLSRSVADVSLSMHLSLCISASQLKSKAIPVRGRGGL
jgi:hypothetical protein